MFAPPLESLASSTTVEYFLTLAASLQLWWWLVLAGYFAICNLHKLHSPGGSSLYLLARSATISSLFSSAWYVQSNLIQCSLTIMSNCIDIDAILKKGKHRTSGTYLPIPHYIRLFVPHSCPLAWIIESNVLDSI